ncbi:MAG: hypothetical protein U9N45_02540 [Gemmatimonadota bacterium]|nr:hypothetical protein [Gemmatimonadota bacterium]
MNGKIKGDPRGMANTARDEFGIEEFLQDVTAQSNEKIKEKVAIWRDQFQKTVSKEVEIVDEEEVLEYLADKRDLGPLSTLFLAFVLFMILPGFLAWIAVLMFLWGVGSFLFRYVWNAKADIPDGYKGVGCIYGRPTDSVSVNTGRNWFFKYGTFCPFKISERDQVVDLKTGNFTREFSILTLGGQITFRITDPAKFIENTSPGGIVKLIDLYADYVSLRIITSIEARIKFTGRESIKNLVDALNGYLSDRYGISVRRGTMPEASNPILAELEYVRTVLESIEALGEKRKMELQRAIKEVESDIRKNIKITRSEAHKLEQGKINLETTIAEEINTIRQQAMINARTTLEQKVSKLKEAYNSLKGKIEKAEAIKGSIAGLETSFQVEEAALKRDALQKLLPKRVQVVQLKGGIEGLITKKLLDFLSAEEKELSRVPKMPAPGTGPVATGESG